MDTSTILQSTQEQAVASGINWLNQMRLDELMRKLTEQDINWEQVLQELAVMKQRIDKLISSNRGGEKGLHGYIAEAAEVGLENAKRLVEGLNPVNEWVDDNGMVDIICDGVPVQVKFVQKLFALGGKDAGIGDFLKKYPDFVKDGGQFVIPKDFYEVVKLMNSVQDKQLATKLFYQHNDLKTVKKILEAYPDIDAEAVINLFEKYKDMNSNYNFFRQWERVQEFFASYPDLSMKDIKPAALDYDDVQRNVIDTAIQHEEDKLKQQDEKIRREAYEASKPTWQEGVKAAGVSATLESGISFCMGVSKKLKGGKKLYEFTVWDWKDVGIDTAAGGAKGGIRAGSVYVMTNFTATPAAVANALVTAVFGVSANAWQLANGRISEEEFLLRSQVMCLDVSISAVASLLGEVMIPVPVLGAVIGNVVGMFLYEIAKDKLSVREQRIIGGYRQQIETLNRRLKAEYLQLIEMLQQEFSKFSSILELAFDEDVNAAFGGSIQLALYVGAKPEKVLKNLEEIDNFFLG